MAKRVLIVEDNFDNREIYAELLRHAGYVTLEAENGLRGVEKAFEHRPDIILMDLSMPLMDGWEAIEVLKKDSRTAAIPVLAVSAHVILNGDYARAREAGAPGHFRERLARRRRAEGADHLQPAGEGLHVGVARLQVGCGGIGGHGVGLV